MDIPLLVVCKIHGVLIITPRMYFAIGCTMCVSEMMRILNIYQFISECTFIHKNKYDYSLVSYADVYGTMKVICKVHSIYDILSRDHLSGIGCPQCGGEAEQFIDSILDCIN